MRPMYSNFFCDAINTLKSEGRYRVFNTLNHSESKFPIAWHSELKKHITVWCTNNYLGMAQHPVVTNAMQDAVGRVGAGAGGTRNIGGTHTSVVELERTMAELHSKDAALVFTSGYVANQGAIAVICKLIPGIVIFSDEMNHASMIHGIKDSGAIKHVFKHNDVQHLETLLSKYNASTPKIIIFESIYSMNGSVAPISQIINLADKYNALTYVDEVHAVGLYGPNGAGIVDALGVSSKIDIIQGNFAKGYGVIGGYIASDNVLIDAVRSYAAPFIFTTTLPTAITDASIASVNFLRYDHDVRLKHMQNVQKVKQRFDELNIPYMRNDSHIIPLMVHDPFKCKKFADILLEEYSIYVQAINYPTVPRGAERLRITPTPMHTDCMIEALVYACKTINEAMV